MNLILFLFTSISVIFQQSTCSDLRKCGPLEPNSHVEVKCFAPRKIGEGLAAGNCSLEQEVGSTATYTCGPYYVPTDSGGTRPSHLGLQCDSKGIWQGLSKFNLFRCKEDCGNSIGNVEPLIINGVETLRSSHPWHALLFAKTKSKINWTYLCGASIIRNQVLLTAAHCIVPSAESFQVVLGGISTNFSENSIETGAQFHSVRRIYISEHYDAKKGYQADIAVLWLSDPIKYSEVISPVCLPNDYSADVSVVRSGVKGQIAGFGIAVNDTSGASNSLRVISLGVKSSTECFNSLHRVLSESQYCAGSETGKTWQTVCNGDSGNGMTFPSSVQGKFYIHGLVSSSDGDIRKGVCQNLAVFTRVYPFVFWIRDILEGISGKVVGDLNQNVPYPYFIAGNEVDLKLYQGLPKEWENRITHLKLHYAQAKLRDLLTSLEYAQTLTSIQFSNVVLEMGIEIGKLSILPFLTEFYIDLLRPDFNLDESRTFPEPLTDSFFKSHLFFTKDYSYRDLTFGDLLNINVDIDLVVQIFKLIHINVHRGDLFLNQVPSSPLLDGNRQGEFKLKNLALHRTELNVSAISGSRSLTSLILSQVRLVGNLDSAIGKFHDLKYLLLDPVRPQHLTIWLDELPVSLVWLSLSSSVSLFGQNSQNVFQFRKLGNGLSWNDAEESIPKKKKVLESLKTFCCNDCHLDDELWENLHLHFPNLSTISIRTNKTVQLDTLLLLPNLTSVLLESETPNLSNFIGLAHRMASWSTFPNVVILKRDQEEWKVIGVSPIGTRRAHFNCNGGKYFWTSEEDFRSKLRLKSFERTAIESKYYIFNGTQFANSLGLERVTFDGIPTQIQSDLQTIVLSDVEVTPGVLSSSIERCTTLKSLSLINSVVLGNGQRYTFTTENMTFVTDFLQFRGFKFEYVYEFVNGEMVAGVVPFQHVQRFNTTNFANTLSRLFKEVSSARLQDSHVTLYTLDSTVGELGIVGKHLRLLIKSLPGGHPLKPMLNDLEEMLITFDQRILPLELKISGFHAVDTGALKPFFNDPLLKFMGRLGLVRYFIKRHGNYLRLLSSPFNQTISFPPIQAIALSLVRSEYLSKANVVSEGTA